MQRAREIIRTLVIHLTPRRRDRTRKLVSARPQMAATQRTASCDAGPRAPPAIGRKGSGDAEQTPTVFEYGWASRARGTRPTGAASDVGHMPLVRSASSLGTRPAGPDAGGTAGAGVVGAATAARK